MTNEIIAKQKQALATHGLDALVAMAPENVIYTCGFVIPSLRLQGLRRRLAATIVTPDQDALVTVDMEASTARRRSKRFSDIRVYSEFDQEASDLLVETLKDFGLSGGRIGIDLDYIPAMDFAVVQKGLPAATFVNADELFLDLRSVKTDEEIARLRTTGRLADSAHKQVQARGRAGMTERDIANIILETLYGGGIEDIGVLVVASGDRSTLPNVGPSDRILQPGDIVRIDILAHIDAYCSDVGRTYVVGEPTAEQSGMWQKMVDTMNVLKDQIRPGVTTGHLYQVFADKYRSVGLDPYKFVGHGLGLSVHEHPWIGRDKRFDRPVQEKMVLCVEPFYMAGDQGYQFEDEILVTKDGFDLITDQIETAELPRIQA
ncbi:MAG: Xaa-Pro peptidase family protein [Ardenticatenaceae bacterium]|nr:Xaa-Pro peptidase family protein [Ardenticatenaceae bacterium]HBY93062.1 peptidase M24 [Chloroflexota bacterium]